MRLWDLEALGTIAAGVFTLNIVCAAVAMSTVALVRSWRAEARDQRRAGTKGSNRSFEGFEGRSREPQSPSRWACEPGGCPAPVALPRGSDL
jgi:hypothetical protein